MNLSQKLVDEEKLPWVSFLVPIYNSEYYIERCARSLFNQTYPNVEYLFCDDYSTDHSVDVLCNIMEQYPDRIEHVRIIRHKKNLHIATTLNNLVDACRTSWLIYIDNDDWVDSDLVEKLVKNQQETGADIVFSGHETHVKGGTYKAEFLLQGNKDDYIKYMLSQRGRHYRWGNLIRRSLFTDNNISIPKDVSNYGEDLFVMIALGCFSSKMVTAPIFAYHYERTREGSFSYMNSNKIGNYAVGTINTLQMVRDFLVENMPQYVKFYDQNIYKEYLLDFMGETARYGNRAVHRHVVDRYKSLIRKYPSLHNSWRNCYKDRIKYSYSLYRLIMMLKSKLGII